MEMGQNNNIVFIILPSFFMLDIYPAMLRSNNLFNIYIDKKTGKRTFRGYSYKDKNRIYQIGTKRGWSYPFDTRFKGRFYNNAENTKFPGGSEWFKAYQKKKSDALKDMELDLVNNKEETSDRYIEKWHKAVNLIRTRLNLSLRETEEWFTTGGVPIGKTTIAEIARKYAVSEANSPVPLS